MLHRAGYLDRPIHHIIDNFDHRLSLNRLIVTGLSHVVVHS